jgi:tetratricopeptide (TPR) repeat protein
MGDYDGASAAGQQALELAATLGDSILQGEAFLRLGRTYWSLGDCHRAVEMLRRNVEAVDQASGTPQAAVWILSQASLAWNLSDLGAFTEGRHHGEEALRLATLAGRVGIRLNAHGSLGHRYLAQGELESASRVLEPGLALCRASDEQTQLRQIAAALGYALALQGRLVEGRALLEEAISACLRTGGVAGLAYRFAWLSEVCRLAGCNEEAWQHGHRALDLAQRQKGPAHEALALHQLGVVQAHAAPPDAAQTEAHYQQALALAEELGMRPLQAHCHLGLGMLYAKSDWPEQARSELSAAVALYRTMEMTFWLPQAEGTLAQVT